MKKRILLWLLALIFIAGVSVGVYNLLYQTVEGTVGFKAINGLKNGVETGIMHQVISPDGPATTVQDADFRPFFPVPDKVAVDHDLAEKLAQKYLGIDYYIGLNLETEERLHPVHIGEGLAYSVSRTDFNRVNAGEKIRCRVSRWVSMSNIDLIGPDK